MSLRVRLLAATIAVLAPPVCAQGRAGVPVASRPASVRPRSPLRVPASVMWIGAHPDDEVLAAPLLALWCREERARCTLLVMTRGDNGSCLLPAGCVPDLATVRSAEAGASSQLFGAHLVLLSLRDGQVGAAGAGGELAATIAGFIRAEEPEVVLTFDPRHGTTCHPDHRAVGSVVLEASSLLPDPPRIYLLETRLTIGLAPVSLAFRAATGAAIRYDANETLSSTGGTAWEAAASDMERQPSQFDAAWLNAFRSTPAPQRAVYVAPAPEILTQAVEGCP